MDVSVSWASAGVGRRCRLELFTLLLSVNMKYFWPQVVGDTPWRLLDRKFAVVSSAAARVGLSTSTESVRDLASEIEWSKASLIAPGGLPTRDRQDSP